MSEFADLRGVRTPPDVDGDTAPTLPEPVDWDELLARERADADWLIEDLWPRARMISITAPRKARKSLLMLYLAACLGAGRHPWTGASVEPINVIYLDHEMTEDDLIDRIEDMAFDAPQLARLRYFLHPAMPMLDQPEGGRVLLDLIDRHAATAVIIDTFSRVVTSKDNTGHEVREFYRWSAGHVKARGVGLARLDHSGHAHTDRAIGTSAKGADVDVGWILKPGDVGTMTLRHLGMTRLGWVPDRLELVQRDNPLAFVRSARTWIAGTAECAADLDTLGVPLDASGNTAQKALRDAGKGRNRRVVLDAVAYRREAR